MQSPSSGLEMLIWLTDAQPRDTIGLRNSGQQQHTMVTQRNQTTSCGLHIAGFGLYTLQAKFT